MIRLVCCLVLLAALAAAQSTSPTASPDSGQQPGQAPPNPLQEPSKTDQQQQAETQRPRQSTFDIGAAASGTQDQELGEVRLMTRYSDINGTEQGKARSFHVPGENNLAEFNYFVDRGFFGGARRFQFLTMFRSTDDSSIDPEHASLQKAYLRIYGPRDEYIFGDALVNYSRLAFNQNIKGLSASWRVDDKWKLSAVGGVFIDRYGSLFKDQPGTCFAPSGAVGFVTSTSPQCGRPFTAAVSGARLEYAFARDSALGFNVATSDDMPFTRRPRPFNEAPSPATNRIGTIDLKWQARSFRMDGEYAYSFTNFDRRPGTCLAPCDSRGPTPGIGVQGDWGARLEASYRYHRLSLRASYVRFQPNFASMNARQIADLQDFLFRASYDIRDWLTIDGTMRRSNDSLKHQLPFEKVIWGPEGRLMFHDLSFYRRAVFEIGYRHRIFDGFNDVVDPVMLTSGGCVTGSSGGMVCLDRYMRSPYAELTLPISTTFFSVGYERRQVVDTLRPGGTSNTDRVYVGLRGIYDWGGWHVNPSMRYELERQGSRPGLDYIAQKIAAGQPITYLDLLLERDSNRLGTASLLVETPRWFIIELAFRDNSATTLAGYSRPSYRAALTYKIANDENKVFIFSFERNNNFYFSQQYPPGGVLNPINFDERLVGVTFVYKFGKRNR